MSWLRRSRQVIPDDVVSAAIDHNVALARALPADLRAQHAAMTVELVNSVSWEAANGFTITDEMKATIAANAVFPVLAHDLYSYRTVKAVIVRPRSTRSHGVRQGPATGTVSDRPLVVDGEAAPRTGPVALSWDSVVHDSRHPQRGRNVVIHEFAHKIDMLDGDADGVPPLRGEALEHWLQVLDDEWDREFAEAEHDILDPYAFTNHAEFFAVATETFFCAPVELQASRPQLYGALRDLYALDPAAWVSDPLR
ncbi:MAG TPA: zinc-dependent peptidase [Ilumatobacteraceae bacterium]|nr:zinc-dependent peptidase [Ilumatobacteraceae bacterium]